MIVKQNVGCVYVIKNNETNKVKIGYSGNVEARLKDLCIGAGCQLELIYKTNQIYDYQEKEAEMHKIFDKYRVFGEWFLEDEKQIVAILQEITKDSKECNIIKAFKNGSNPTTIANKLKTSRTGVVKYLRSKGYKIKNRAGDKFIYVINEPEIIKQIRFNIKDMIDDPIPTNKEVVIDTKPKRKPTKKNGEVLSHERLAEMVKANNEKLLKKRLGRKK